jgi:hypothetical protein
MEILINADEFTLDLDGTFVTGNMDMAQDTVASLSVKWVVKQVFSMIPDDLLLAAKTAQDLSIIESQLGKQLQDPFPDAVSNKISKDSPSTCDIFEALALFKKKNLHSQT